jgi:hypothetical protein
MEYGELHTNSNSTNSSCQYDSSGNLSASPFRRSITKVQITIILQLPDFLSVYTAFRNKCSKTFTVMIACASPAVYDSLTRYT